MTNRSEPRPKIAGMLHPNLAGFVSRLRTLWPSSRAKFNTCRVRIPRVPPSARIPSAFQQRPSSLSRPTRSVFVGRVSAAGSGGNGRESGAPRRRRVWCGVQRGPHAQVSVGLLFFYFFSLITAAPGVTECVSFFVAEKDAPQFSMAEQKRHSINEKELYYFFF